VEFCRERVDTTCIDLYTKFDEDSSTNMITIRFLVMDVKTSYNILLGQPPLNVLGIIISTVHLTMKFLS